MARKPRPEMSQLEAIEIVNQAIECKIWVFAKALGICEHTVRHRVQEGFLRAMPRPTPYCAVMIDLVHYREMSNVGRY